MPGMIDTERASMAGASPVALTSFYRQMSGFSATLIDLRDEFEGDMDRFLVYLIVLLDDVSRAARGAGSQGCGVSALSIAEITRIPRETVRRKVNLLVSAGLLRREGYAHYHVTDTSHSPSLLQRFAPPMAERESPVGMAGGGIAAMHRGVGATLSPARTSPRWD